MGVVEAKIQTVEEIYRLVWAAVARRHPIAASYNVLPRLFCPHRLGGNKEDELRVLCYQYGRESGLRPLGSSANWRCIVLEKWVARPLGRVFVGHAESVPEVLTIREAYREWGKICAEHAEFGMMRSCPVNPDTGCI